MKILRNNLFYILAMMLCLSGCSRNQGEKIRIAYLPLTHAVVLQELANSGELEIELIKYGSWPELLDALNTGRVDAASVLIEPAMKAHEQGIGLTALALGHRDGNVVIVANEVNTAGDLRGKTFAIPHRASSHFILLSELLKREGIEESEIKVIELPPPEMPSALAACRIAGYCVAEPFGAIAVHGGYGKVLIRSEELWPDSICCALVANDRFLTQRPEAAKQLLSAYLAAGQCLGDKDIACQHAKTLLQQPEEVLEISMKWISYSDLQLTPESYESLRNKVIDCKISSQPPTYENFVIQNIIVP